MLFCINRFRCQEWAMNYTRKSRSVIRKYGIVLIFWIFLQIVVFRSISLTNIDASPFWTYIRLVAYFVTPVAFHHLIKWILWSDMLSLGVLRSLVLLSSNVVQLKCRLICWALEMDSSNDDARLMINFSWIELLSPPYVISRGQAMEIFRVIGHRLTALMSPLVLHKEFAGIITWQEPSVEEPLHFQPCTYSLAVILFSVQLAFVPPSQCAPF